MKKTPLIILLTSFFLFVLTSLAVSFYAIKSRTLVKISEPLAVHPLQKQMLSANLFPESNFIAPIKLIDHNNQAMTSLIGRWHLVFIGYTHCPDICPVEMQVLKKAYQGLSQSIKSQLQVLFISADPARDTTDVLSKYVNYFDHSFIGVTGEMTDLVDASRKLGLLFIPIDEMKKKQPNYQVNHSATFVLTDAQGRLVAKFFTPHKVESLIKDIEYLIKNM